MNLNELEDALQQINGQLMTEKEMQYVYHVSHILCHLFNFSLTSEFFSYTVSTVLIKYQLFVNLSFSMICLDPRFTRSEEDQHAAV